MSITGQNVIDNALNLLNEASNSSVGQYGSNNASSPTYTTTQGLILAFNDTAGRMCTKFYGWQDTGSFTYAANAQYVPLNGLTTTLGGTIWRALSVTWNGVQVAQTDFAHARINFPTLASDPSGAPTCFFMDAQFNLCLAPKPSAGDTVIVTGYATPPELTSGTLSSNLIWITDADAPALAYGIAALIAQKNSEDLNISGKVYDWTAEFNAAWVRLYERLDSAHAKAYFAMPSQYEIAQGQRTQ